MAGRGDAAAARWRVRGEATSGRRTAGESDEIERVSGKSVAALGLLPTKQSVPSARSRALDKYFFLIKKYTLPSAPDRALGKDLFAACPLTGTRQSVSLVFLPSVPRGTLGKDYFIVLCRVPPI
jgi:hypothetical protein